MILFLGRNKKIALRKPVKKFLKKRKPGIYSVKDV